MSLSARRAGWLLVSSAAVLMAGCGGGTTVSGEVTYDGTPVEKGSITFTPADGKGSAVSAPVVKGRYTAVPIEPGPKVVKVESVRAPAQPLSTEEMAKKAAEAKGKPPGVESADLIPANAEGNNAKVEVKAGGNTQDFHLKKPAGRK